MFAQKIGHIEQRGETLNGEEGRKRR